MAGCERYAATLSQKKYYKNTQYGYARGQEPVDYVYQNTPLLRCVGGNDEQPAFKFRTARLFRCGDSTAVIKYAITDLPSSVLKTTWLILRQGFAHA